MSSGFLNLVMLAGLAATALPILAHLLSKKRYDVVHWGAMQFLELGQRTRRRIRLEELLLLLLRMGLIALLVFALARPWLAGGLFESFAPAPARDVVLIIDGSGSMQRQVDGITLHAAALEWAHAWVDGLHPGDTVTLIDARSQPRLLLDGPTSDLGLVRRELDRWAKPGSTSDLAASLMTALRILSTTTHLSREVIVLTDRQRLPWRLEDERLWRLLDEARQLPAVPPRLVMVDLSQGEGPPEVNFSIDRLQLSRELTAPGFPVRVTATIRQTGGNTTQRQVYLEVNGQRQVDRTLMVTVPGDGQTNVDFEQRFDQPGSYLIGVALDEDDLPGDDRSQAVVVVSEGLPVLLVDGAPGSDPVRREAFFLQTAFRLSGRQATLVAPRAVEASEWSNEDLADVAVVFLLNVPHLTPEQVGWLREFAESGGGVVIAPGDQTDAGNWNSLLTGHADGLVRVGLGNRVSSDPEHPQPALRLVRVENESLQVSWLQRFRAERGVDFHLVRFGTWWQLTPDATPSSDDSATEPGDRPPVVIARLTSGDPLMILEQRGLGTIVLLAAPLDADWSTWPSSSDYLPFVHELTFQLARGKTPRNVEAGAPLTWTPVAGHHTSEDLQSIEVLDPEGRAVRPRQVGSDEHPRLVLDGTLLTGLYRWVDPRRPERSPDLYFVQEDRSESTLDPLTEEDLALLTAENRLHAAHTLADVLALQERDPIRSEIWRWLMLLVLGMLVVELVLTRHLVRKGHEDLSLDDA